MAQRPLPLAVDVVWLGAAGDGPPPIADALFRELTGDPDGRDRSRTGIPVFFRRIHRDEPMADPEAWVASWPAAEGRVVVVALDDAMVAAASDRTSPVRRFATALLSAAEAQQWRLLPVTLSKQALSTPFTREHNAVRVLDPGADDVAETVAGLVALETLRYLAPLRTVQVFISYASADGRQIAERVKAFIDGDTHLKAFLDRADIHAGEEFTDVLQANVVAGPLVAVVTDAYAASIWCGREIMLAKEAGQPVVVLDATTTGCERAFPYLGNGPVTRWRAEDEEGACRRAVRLATRDRLRATYLERRVAHIAALAGMRAPDRVLGRAPELLTLVGLVPPDALVVYPDPPVPSIEGELLGRAFPGLSLRTPTELWCRTVEEPAE